MTARGRRLTSIHVRVGKSKSIFQCSRGPRLGLKFVTTSRCLPTFWAPSVCVPPLFVFDLRMFAAVVQAQSRQDQAVSDRGAREAVQCKANSAMNGVVEAQDRLVRALQAELDMTNRAREATQVSKGGGDERATCSFICARLYSNACLPGNRGRCNHSAKYMLDRKGPFSLLLVSGSRILYARPQPRFYVRIGIIAF